MKKVPLIIFTLLNYSLFAQLITLYSNDFETSTPLDLVSGSTNSWLIGDCAGNGISEAGTKALYTTKGGTVPGCGIDGESQYAFEPSNLGESDELIASVSVDGRCTRYHKISFDYKYSLEQENSFVILMYKNGSGPWLSLDTLPMATDWTAREIDVHFSTNGNDFEVGLFFEYNYNTATGSPIAVDNVVITGESAVASILNDTLAICGQTSTILNAEPYSAGTGSWSIISGQGTLNNMNSYTTGVNNLQVGTSVFVWTVNSAHCGNSFDTVTVINSLAPSPANVQDTFFACSMDQLNISTATPAAGTGMWSSPQGAVIQDPSSPVTVVTTIPNGWSELIWTISSPGCPSNIDTMVVFNVGGQKFVTNDTTLCMGDLVDFIAVTNPTDSLQTENFLFGQGNGLVNHLTDDTISISNLQGGMNILLYEVEHEYCPKEVDTLKINVIPCDGFEPIFPTVITPNGDGFNDLFIIQNLENVYPECEVVIFNRYGNVVFESVGYSEPWDGTFKGEKLPMGAYFFKLDLKDSENTIYNGTISLIH